MHEEKGGEQESNVCICVKEKGILKNWAAEYFGWSMCLMKIFHIFLSFRIWKRAIMCFLANTHVHNVLHAYFTTGVCNINLYPHIVNLVPLTSTQV